MKKRIEQIIMRKRQLMGIMVFLFVVLTGFLGSGQVMPADSLQQYLEIAVRNNPELRQKFNEYLAALEKVPQVGNLPDPEFSFGIFIKPMELLGGNQVADFQLMQMFPWFGTLRSARDEASLMARARFEAFRDARQEIWFNVRTAWLQLYLNQAKSNITRKNLALLQAIERIALNRFSFSIPREGADGGGQGMNPERSSGTMGNSRTAMQASGMTGSGQASMNAGMSGSVMTGSGQASMSVGMSASGTMEQMGGSSDLIALYRIQIEMGDLENRLDELNTTKSVLTAAMNSLLNRPSLMPVTLPDTLLPGKLPVNLAAIRDSIRLNNAMITMLIAEKQAFDERIRMSKRMSYPMFGVGIEYMLINPREGNPSMMNGKDMFMPMGKITLPIYQGKYSAMRKEAEFLSIATDHQISATKNTLLVAYTDRLKMLDDANRRIELYSKQSILAFKTLDLMIAEFSVSGTGLDELLRIEQQLLDYEVRKLEAIVENQIAIAGLDRLMSGAGGAQRE